jgi:prephenate dehydrogenase
VDTAPLKKPVLAWADEILPEQVHFVGGNPILAPSEESQSGLEGARADLFRKGLFCLVPSPTADSAAVKLATDLVSILGAKPLYFDPVEHDGQLAFVEHLPLILGLALLQTATEQPTWRELRKVAGPAFRSSTDLAVGDPAAASELCLSNRENVARWIDALIASLASIRQSLIDNQAEELAGRFTIAKEERDRWLQDWASGEWYEGSRTEMPTRRSMMDNLFGTFWRRKPKRDES